MEKIRGGKRPLPIETKTAPKDLRKRARWAEQAAEKISQKRAATMFLTRTQGTPRQVGQVFPVLGSKSNLPKIHYRRPTYIERRKLTDLELMAAKEERKLLDLGFKAWLIAVKYKDGSTEEIPIIAKDYQSALDKAKPKMNQVSSQIDEIVIIDPKIGEILHKIGTSAMVAARKIARGVKMAPEKLEKAGIKTARKLGRIAAMPAEFREAYEAAKAERPWLKPEQFAKEQHIPIKTVEDWRRQPTPAIYKPKIATEEYTPGQLVLLREATRQSIAKKAAKRAVPSSRLNGRALRPFGIPMREYQLRTIDEPKTETAERIELARRRAAWEERAPVTIL